MKHSIKYVDHQAEIRIEAGGANLLVIVSPRGGWNFGREYVNNKPRSGYSRDTSEYNVRISTNNSMLLTKDEWVDISNLIHNTYTEMMSK